MPTARLNRRTTDRTEGRKWWSDTRHRASIVRKRSLSGRRNKARVVHKDKLSGLRWSNQLFSYPRCWGRLRCGNLGLNGELFRVVKASELQARLVAVTRWEQTGARHRGPNDTSNLASRRKSRCTAVSQDPALYQTVSWRTNMVQKASKRRRRRRIITQIYFLQ